ncbi:MAG: M20/M25/M40 family metallo-hydrolase [Dehalococcoidia bacterium]
MATLAELLSQVDTLRDEIISLERDLVRIPTVNTGVMPTGDETKVCRFLSDLLEREGIRGEILESAPSRGNYIARMKGSGAGPTLLYMAHTDVVPVETEDRWICPPFSGDIIDGRLYGRGATDCKGLLTCQVMAAVILKRAGVRLEGDLILAATADEETGGKYGFRWLAQNHPEMIKADYAINEGGGEVAKREGGPAYMFGIGEKGRLEAHITVKGTPCHASTPWNGDNAVAKASRVLQRLEEYRPEIDVSTELFRHLRSLGVEEEPTPQNIGQIAEELAQRDKQLGSLVRGLSRMTISPTMISGGIKSNSIPSACRITCDVRILPHQDEEYVRREVGKIVEGIPDVEVEIDYTAVPSLAPYETEFAARVRAATEQALDGSEAVWIPTFSTGFTDSRFVRPLGILTYGFQVSHPEDEVDKANIHGTNESVDVRNLVVGTKMLVALAVDVLG